MVGGESTSRTTILNYFQLILHSHTVQYSVLSLFVLMSTHIIHIYLRQQKDILCTIREEEDERELDRLALVLNRAPLSNSNIRTRTDTDHIPSTIRSNDVSNISNAAGGVPAVDLRMSFTSSSSANAAAAAADDNSKFSYGTSPSLNMLSPPSMTPSPPLFLPPSLLSLPSLPLPSSLQSSHIVVSDITNVADPISATLTPIQSLVQSASLPLPLLLCENSREMKLKEGLELIDSFNIRIQSNDSDLYRTEIGISGTNENNTISDNGIDIDNLNINSNINQDCQHDKLISEKREKYFELFDKMKILASSVEERNFKIYFRTSGALSTLLKNCKIKCEFLINDNIDNSNGHNDCVVEALNQKDIGSKSVQKNQKINNVKSDEKTVYIYLEIVKYLNLICVLIESERSSLSRTAESGLINTVKLLLTKLEKRQQQKQEKEIEEEQGQERIQQKSSSRGGKDIDDGFREKSFIQLIVASVHFLRLCCHDDICEKSRNIVSTDRNVLPTLGNIIGNFLLSAWTDRGRDSCSGRNGTNSKVGSITEKERNIKMDGLKGNLSVKKSYKEIGKRNGEGECREQGTVMRNLDLIIELILECSHIGRALSFLISGNSG